MACYGLKRWIKIALMSYTCQNYVVRSNSWQFRPCTLSLRAHTTSRCRLSQIASQLHHIIRHDSQEFDLFRLQLHHIIRHHSQEFNLFRLHLCRALSWPWWRRHGCHGGVMAAAASAAGAGWRRQERRRTPPARQGITSSLSPGHCFLRPPWSAPPGPAALWGGL